MLDEKYFINPDTLIFLCISLSTLIWLYHRFESEEPFLMDTISYTVAPVICH